MLFEALTQTPTSTSQLFVYPTFLIAEKQLGMLKLAS